MAKSIATIQFTSIPLAATTISLSNSLAVEFEESFVNTRTASNMTEIAVAPTATIPQQCQNFITAFNLDWNATLLYDVSFDGIDTVTIDPKEWGTILAVTKNTTGATITINTIALKPPVTDFQITSTSFSEATTDPCNNIKITVTANDTIDYQLTPTSITGILAPTYSFDYIRGSYIAISLKSISAYSAIKTLQLPDTLSSDNLTITITPSLNGASIAPTLTNINLLTLQYSINNVNWQTDNIFSGQAAGNYTMYIKDQYGCTISKAYVVNTFVTSDFGVNTPYTYISKSCSFQYSKREAIDNIDTYKTDENVFAFEALNNINGNNISDLQLFQTNDYITEEFQSNYETNTVKLIEENGTINNILITKQTTNIGRKDKRECTFYAYSPTQVGVYFTSGKTYDYDTGVTTGTYALNGTLPEFAIVGELISINNVAYEIKQTLYDEVVGYDIILIDYAYSGGTVNSIISSIYNIEIFEVYNYDIDFSLYSGLVEIQVEMTDTKTNFPDVLYITENIDVQTLHANTLEVIYYNDTNSDVYYTTGIQHKLRLEFDGIEPVLPQDFENSINDNDTIAISSSIHEANKFLFSSIFNERMKKIVLALSHKFVFINRIGYTKNSDISIKPIESTNMSDIEAEMIKTGISYTSNGINELNAVQVDMPALLNVNNDYIKTN